MIWLLHLGRLVVEKVVNILLASLSRLLEIALLLQMLNRTQLYLIIPLLTWS